MKFEYLAFGSAELVKPVSFVVEIPGGPTAKGETVSTIVWAYDEKMTFDREVSEEEVRTFIEPPYEGYLFTKKEEDIKVKFVRRFPAEAPEEAPQGPVKD